MPPKATFPKTTATREYFTSDPSDAPDSPTLQSASPTPSPVSPPSQPSPNLLTQSTDSLVDIRHPEPPTSPTPSDIITNAALEDVEAMVEYDRDMKAKGMGEKERKEKLLEMQERLEEERERRLGRFERETQGLEPDTEEEEK